MFLLFMRQIARYGATSKTSFMGSGRKNVENARVVVGNISRDPTTNLRAVVGQVVKHAVNARAHGREWSGTRVKRVVIARVVVGSVW